MYTEGLALDTMLITGVHEALGWVIASRETIPQSRR